MADEQLLNQLRQIQAEVETPATSGDPLAAPAVGSKLRFNLGGQPMEFESQQQFEQNFAKWQSEIAAERQRMAAELEAARRQAAAAQQVPQQQTEQPTQQSKFNNKKYFELLEQDPMAADTYLQQFKMFGREIPGVDPTQLIGTMLLNQSNEVVDLRLAQQFQGRLNWNDPQVRRAMDAERERLGKPKTPEGYEDTWARMVVAGQVPSPAQLQAMREQAAGVTPIRQGLPSTGPSSTGPVSNDEQNMIDTFYRIEADPSLTPQQKLDKFAQFRSRLANAR